MNYFYHHVSIVVVIRDVGVIRVVAVTGIVVLVIRDVRFIMFIKVIVLVICDVLGDSYFCWNF